MSFIVLGVVECMKRKLEWEYVPSDPKRLLNNGSVAHKEMLVYSQ